MRKKLNKILKKRFISLRLSNNISNDIRELSEIINLNKIDDIIIDDISHYLDYQIENYILRKIKKLYNLKDDDYRIENIRDYLFDLSFDIKKLSKDDYIEFKYEIENHLSI